MNRFASLRDLLSSRSLPEATTYWNSHFITRETIVNPDNRQGGLIEVSLFQGTDIRCLARFEANPFFAIEALVGAFQFPPPSYRCDAAGIVWCELQCDTSVLPGGFAVGSALHPLSRFSYTHSLIPELRLDMATALLDALAAIQETRNANHPS